MTIDNATFVVTDVETTGTKAAQQRILELGAVKIRDGEIVDRFQQLINPERTVPSRITQITGISTGMVYDKPVMEEVMPGYLDFLGDGIFTAHNLPFDLGFVNEELKRLGKDELENSTLCTLRLARRLLPGLKSKGLTRLAQFYGVTVDGRHRALGDAEATGVILKRFFSQLAFEHDITEVDELLSFQNRRYKKVRQVPRHIKKIRNERLPDLPDEPGVYFLKGSGGKTLYIGKAKTLSDRVRSYFNAIESHAERKRKMMQKVRGVEWEVTDTELEAMLTESRLIKSEKPRYNRAQRRYVSRPFLVLDATHEFPTISWSRTLSDDGAEYYGPVRNVEQAERVVEVVHRFFSLRKCNDHELSLGRRCLYADMDRCPAPCETGDTDVYAEAVDAVRAFLTGQDTSVLDHLESRMQQASQNLEFEKAAQFRDWRKMLKRMLEKQQTVAAPVLEHNAALVHQRDETRTEVLLVRFGRFVQSIVCPIPVPHTALDALRAAVGEHFDPEMERPATLTKEDVDAIRLLSHWTYARRNSVQVVRWDEAAGRRAFVESIVEVLPEEEA